MDVHNPNVKSQFAVQHCYGAVRFLYFIPALLLYLFTLPEYFTLSYSDHIFPGNSCGFIVFIIIPYFLN